MMNIIACDPGVAKPSAFAVFTKEKLIKTFKTNNLLELDSDFYKNDILIIEDQYLGFNTKTLIDLVRQTGKIIGLAEYIRLDIYIVPPSKWQSWHNIPRKQRDISAYEWKKIHKQHLIDKATELTGVEIKDDDEASAILIGLWFIGSNK